MKPTDIAALVAASKDKKLSDATRAVLRKVLPREARDKADYVHAVGRCRFASAEDAAEYRRRGGR